MKKYLLLLFVFVCVFKAFSLQSSSQTITKIKDFTVVLDPGHGGKDPGAMVGKIKEKHIVLNVSNMVGELLKKHLPEVNVVFTRKTDVFIPLNVRAYIANNAKANLFVSIHANACGASYIYGTETYTLGLHESEENLEVAKKENAAILLEDDYSQKYQGFDPNSSESYIIFELLQNSYLDKSIDFAQMMQGQFRNRVGRKDRGVRQAGFLVLRETAMPSALVELGYLTNRNEKEYLASQKGQEALALGIFHAISNYIEKQAITVPIDLNRSLRSGQVNPEDDIKEELLKPKIVTPSIEQTKQKDFEIFPEQKDEDDLLDDHSTSINTVPEQSSALSDQMGGDSNNDSTATPINNSSDDGRVLAPTLEVSESIDDDASGSQTSKDIEKKDSPKSGSEEKKQAIEFCVQIGASRVVLPNPNQHFHMNEHIEERFVNGYYKYFAGSYSNYSDCIVRMRIVRKSVKNAFPVAFDSGEPIDLQKARQKTR